MAQNWGEGGSQGVPSGDFTPRRVGADPPEVLPQLRRAAEQSLLAACGVPTTVLDSNSSAGRESFRQFLHLTIAPVARQVSGQIQAAFELDSFAFTFDRLMASDLSGRARSFGQLVSGGMAIERAAALSNLLEPE